MKSIFFGLFLICTLAASAQNYLDKKVTVTLQDTSNIYERIRTALGKNNFQIREDGNRDTITTFPKGLGKTNIVARAIVNGNAVTISGIYGLTYMDDWGYTRPPKDF
jgi:hypothetical protein